MVPASALPAAIAHAAQADVARNAGARAPAIRRAVRSRGARSSGRASRPDGGGARRQPPGSCEADAAAAARCARPMLRYLVRRLLLTIPVLLGVATLVFALIHFIPGDPAQAMLGEGAAQEEVAQLRARLGLDRPLLVQYGAFLNGVGARRSWRVAAKRSAGGCSRSCERMPATAELALASMAVAVLIALPLGIIAAVWRGTSIDLRRHDALACRHLDSEFLAGAADGHRLCRSSSAGCRWRARHARASGASGGHARRGARGDPGAHDARQPAGRTAASPTCWPRAPKACRARAPSLHHAFRNSLIPDRHDPRLAVRRRAHRQP